MHLPLHICVCYFPLDGTEDKFESAKNDRAPCKYMRQCSRVTTWSKSKNIICHAEHPIPLLRQLVRSFSSDIGETTSTYYVSANFPYILFNCEGNGCTCTVHANYKKEVLNSYQYHHLIHFPFFPFPTFIIIKL